MDKIEQCKADYLEGKIDADRNGYISTGGITFKAPERTKVYASAGRGSHRPSASPRAATGNAAAEWATAIQAAMVHCGSRHKATAYVAKKRPELRARLVAEANAGQAPRAHRGQSPVARRQPGHQRPTPRARGATNGGGMSKDQFGQQVAKLMEDGLSKREAALQLSKSMGLSQQPEQPGYFEQGRQHYFN